MVKVGHFGAAHAGGVEKFEHGAIAQAEGVGGVGNGKEALDFLLAEEFGEVAGMFARQVEIGGGVGGDDAGAAEPGEEAPDAAEAGELGVDDKCQAAAQAAVWVEKRSIGDRCLDGTEK